MLPIVNLLHNIIVLYNFVLIAYVVISWLIAFNIINRHQPIVSKLYAVLIRLTEPVLRPIRNALPDLGIDISPIVVILLLHFIDEAMYTYLIGSNVPG